MREATEVHAGIKCCCFSCHHSLPLPPPPLLQTRSQNAFTNLPPKVLKTDASIRVSSASASVDKQRGRAPPPSASLAIPRRRRQDGARASLCFSPPASPVIWPAKLLIGELIKREAEVTLIT